MKVYAIRHKPTGNYICGKTIYEPQEWTDKRCARLFPNKTNASRALTAWLQGYWRYSYSPSEDGGDYYLEPSPRSGRKREDMEIVCFTLKRIT